VIQVDVKPAIRRLSGPVDPPLIIVAMFGLGHSFVMCPSERARSSAMRLSAATATKRTREQKADYVPGHIIGKLLQLAFIKSAPGVGGGFADGVDGEVLECAAVLHDVPSLGGFERAGWLERDGLSRPLS